MPGPQPPCPVPGLHALRQSSLTAAAWQATHVTGQLLCVCGKKGLLLLCSTTAGEPFCTTAPLLTAHHCLFCSSSACLGRQRYVCRAPRRLPSLPAVHNSSAMRGPWCVCLQRDKLLKGLGQGVLYLSGFAAVYAAHMAGRRAQVAAGVGAALFMGVSGFLKKSLSSSGTRPDSLQRSRQLL